MGEGLAVKMPASIYDIVAARAHKLGSRRRRHGSAADYAYITPPLLLRM